MESQNRRTALPAKKSELPVWFGHIILYLTGKEIL